MVSTGWLIYDKFNQQAQLEDFLERTHYRTSFTHPGLETPGKVKIVLRGERPFSVYASEYGRNREGFSGYGVVMSNGLGEAVISVWMDRDSETFVFILDRDLSQNPIEISSTKKDQEMEPHFSYLSPGRWAQEAWKSKQDREDDENLKQENKSKKKVEPSEKGTAKK